ncbi:calcium-transporting ATPase 12, plasma membrane-type-like isoform X1 [Coffea arabica]|uniref:Calcium-transporting ATPase 12, plasma membrane-type-like isoform X1 n=2 Tax=Coffea arabica TaxID=13443 RepID=A0ABM4X957_COFAR
MQVLLETMSGNSDESTISTVMDIEPARFANFDPSSITTLVRTRNRRLLQDLGGLDAIIRALETDTENGIRGDSRDIDARRNIFSSNSNQLQERNLVKCFCVCAVKAIKDPLIIIVVVFTVLSLGFGIKKDGLEWIWPEGVIKLLAIFTVVIVSAGTNFWPITQCHDSSGTSSYTPQVDVVRAGEWTKIPISSVVVGDIVFLKPGDQVPGDALFIDGSSLHLENLINVNGRSECVEVGHENKNPFLFSGSMVVDGYARIVVTADGKNKRNHQQVIWMEGKHADELLNLTTVVGKLGQAVAFATFFLFLCRFFAGNVYHDDKKGNKALLGDEKVEIWDHLLAFVGILAAPALIALTSGLEGLVLAVKITLAYSLRKLMHAKVLVRKPSLCHSVASVDTICLNKTGTLTAYFAEVKKFWLGLSSIEEAPHNLIAPNVLELLHQAIGLNTIQPRSANSTFAPPICSTEAAISDWAVRHFGMDKENLRQSCTILVIEPFNSTNKRSGVLISKNNDNTIHVHRKGAADVILPMCSHYYETTGIVNVINKTTRALLEQILEGMTKNGFRCIAFAHRKTSIEEYFNFSKQQLTLLGLVGLKNPLRNGVKRVVKDCQRAGINLKLLTGDNILTATVVASRSGILEPDNQPGEIIEGEEFRNYTSEERIEKLDTIRVVAGATPFDKFLMVQSLKKKGNVVAYLGRGLGDVQALREADVGLCFGTQGGTEILKACSNIVIQKKDLSIVFDILRWGRGFYVSIQIYTQFLITATLVDLVVDFVMSIFPSDPPDFDAMAVISSGKIPYPVFQLLWVKLILGFFAAISLIIKQPSEELMSKPPRDRDEPLMNDVMQRSISAQAIYQIAVLLAIHFKGQSILKVNVNEKNTLIFTTYVLCQVSTVVNARLFEEKKIFQEMHNKKCFWGIIGFIVLLHGMLVEVLKNLAGTARLDSRQWGICFLIAAASTPISGLLKYATAMRIPFLTNVRGTNPKAKID